MNRHLIYLVLLLLFVMLAACRTPEETTPTPPPTPTPVPTPTPTPKEIVTQTAVRMEELAGFHFAIEHSGSPAYLDVDEIIAFRRAEGDYVAPDRAQADVRVILPGLVTDLSVVSIDALQWQTNPLTGQWEELPPDWGFNPTILFRDNIGLQAILASDLTEAVMAGTGKLEDGSGKTLDKITGTVAGERVVEMSGGLIGPEPAAVELWIDPDTLLLHRILLTEPTTGDEEEPSVWQIDFTQFDQVIEIAPPENAE